MAETPVLVGWPNGQGIQQALWRSERGAPPPTRVVLADDTLSADTAYRLACQGTGLLWQGDFNNARLLLQAMTRRADRPLRRHEAARRAASKVTPVMLALPSPEPLSTLAEEPGPEAEPAPSEAAAAFYRYRQAKGQRAQVLSMLLMPLQADYGMALRRAPNLRLACLQAWGPADLEELPPVVAAAGPHSVASLRDLLGIVGAFEWRKKGVPIAALGPAPDNRIHPHYGVFSPVRGEYVDLVAHTPLPAAAAAGGPVFDIGTGTGVLAAVLARRSAGGAQAGPLQVTATDCDARALACAQDNLRRLQLQPQVQVLQADLFPPGQAALVVCNPPWLPLRPGSPLERAVYDEDSRMLKGFLNGLPAHLLPGGEGWLILSDLAEHLGLRTRQQLLGWVAAAGLQVLGRVDTRPTHRKVEDTTDLLHAARAAEVTSLWRLGQA